MLTSLGLWDTNDIVFDWTANCCGLNNLAGTFGKKALILICASHSKLFLDTISSRTIAASSFSPGFNVTSVGSSCSGVNFPGIR